MRPPDAVRIANTREWLLRAEEDLASAERLLRDSPPLLRTALFHCQQAAEKAFKGWLTWHDVPFRRIHVLEELAEACLQLDPTLEPVVNRTVPLSAYAVRFRYPGAPYEPSLDEARNALTIAHEAVEAVKGRLPEQARP